MSTLDSSTSVGPTRHGGGAKARRIARFVGVRVMLGLITLWLLSMIVFAGGQLLPGDVGRAILGLLADARAVAALNHQLGVDRPLVAQYTSWISHFLRGDMGESYAFRAPVAPFIGSALWSLAKLGTLAFVVVVPLGIVGGAACGTLNRPRLISIGGLTATVVPEFVSSIVLILIFGVWLQWLPIKATAPAGVRVLHATQTSDPAGAAAGVRVLRLLYIGDGARRHRRGARCRLHSHRDSQGPAASHAHSPARVAQRVAADRDRGRDPARLHDRWTGRRGNAVPLSEGIGSLIYKAAKAKNFPMLEAGVLTIGVIYTAANLIADALYVELNPRLCTSDSRRAMSTTIAPQTPVRPKRSAR